jgi:hypothetical protein
LFGCASTNPKVTANAIRSISSASTVKRASAYPPDLFAQYIVSLETGLACTNELNFDFPDVVVEVGSPSPQQTPAMPKMAAFIAYTECRSRALALAEGNRCSTKPERFSLQG